MASSNDLTDYERMDAELREERLLAQLETARGMKNNCMHHKWDLRKIERDRSGRGLHHTEYERAASNHESVQGIVQRLTLDVLIYRLKRNDKDTVVVDCGELSKGYGEPLGYALQYNTMVTTLALSTDNFLAPGDQFVFPETEPWHDFFSTSPSLVNVRIRDDSHDPMLRVPGGEVAFMLELVCASNIQKLVLWGVYLSPIEFKSLMTIPRSLREVSIRFRRQRWTDEDRRRVTEGLEDNHVLRRLTLEFGGSDFFYNGNEEDDSGDEDDGEDPMPTHVVKNLHLLRSLQVFELELDVLSRNAGYSGIRGLFCALERYLQSVDTVDTFRALGIRHIFMRKSLMTKLLSGLGQTANGVQRVAVSELTFSFCDLDVRSLNQLVAFLQTPTTDECKSSLRKLCVCFSLHETFGDEEELDDEDQEPLWERLAEALLVQMDATSSVVVETIGSQIEELHIQEVHPSFLHYMGTHAGRVRVKHLGLHIQVPDAISSFLPKLGALTSLTLKDIEDRDPYDIDHSAMINGVKHNGSITVFSTGGTARDPFSFNDYCLFTGGPKYTTNFDEKELRLIGAYVQRNKFLSSYQIGHTSTTDDTEGTDDAAPTDASNSDCGPLQVEVSQLPAILRTAMIGPGVSRLAGGLLKGDEHIGR